MPTFWGENKIKLKFRQFNRISKNWPEAIKFKEE